MAGSAPSVILQITQVSNVIVSSVSKMHSVISFLKKGFPSIVLVTVICVMVKSTIALSIISVSIVTASSASLKIGNCG